MKLPSKLAPPRHSWRQTVGAREAGIGHNRPDFSSIVADKIERISPDLLKPPKRRTRKHSKAKIAKLMGSISAFGWIVPIIIDENNIILSGNAQLEAAKELGLAEVPVVRVGHLNEEEKRAFAIAANRLAELGDWDQKELALELKELLEIDFHFDLDVIGFDTPQIDVIIAEAAAETETVEEADVLPEPTTGRATCCTGDLWQLGRHRLLCGNSLEKASFDLLMNGAKVRMIETDAPYNVPVAGHVSGLGKVKHREFAMASGEMSRGEFTNFLATVIGHAKETALPGALVYLFMDWRHTSELLAAAEANELRPVNMACWDKLSGAMGSLYRSQHELCWIFKVDDASHVNNVELGKHGRYRTNVWQHRGLSSFGKGRDEALADHPTVKPWVVLADAIKDCTHRGDIVLDPFLGSGSTLVAAEKTGRACYGIELDPVYCDTIVRRWEKVSGKQAIHVATSKTFAALAAQREDEAARLIEVGVPNLAASGSPAVRHRARPAVTASSNTGGDHA